MVHLDKPLSLNPFGTGKVFKLNLSTVEKERLGLNPFGTGKVFKRTACSMIVDEKKS